MSGWTDVFLGVIAAATLITSILQVGVLVAAGRVAMRLMRLVDRIEHEVKPLFGHLDVRPAFPPARAEQRKGDRRWLRRRHVQPSN